MSTMSAAEYLASTNFKSMVEWLTAEVLFNRPEDPLAYVQKAVSAKLQARGSAPYSAKDNDTYLQETYEDPSIVAAAPAAAGAGASDSYDDEVLTQRLALLEKVISASRAIAMELNPLEANKTIISECCNIIEADRATLFRLDEESKELELLVAEGAKSIRVPLGTGIAGTVGATGEVINIPDAYADSRFDSSHDSATGYKTQSILCAPVRDGLDRIVGVIQAINCAHGPFNDIDQEIITVLAAQAGVALKNAELYQESVRSREKVRSLLEIIKAMHSNLGINSLMFTITTRAHKMVDADRCTFFIANHNTNELWAMQGEVDIRIPIDKGIAGAVATTQEIINIPDAYSDDRFNQDIDKASGYRTRSILCMPLIGTAEKVVGVIQVINKGSGAFNDDDIDMMASFLTMAAPIIENSQLFQTVAAKTEEEGTEFSGKSLLSPLARAGSHKAMPGPVIEEGDEEEEESDEDEE